MTAMGPSKTFASAFVFLTILDALWIGEAQPCENFLASLVTPSALHHVNGAAVTLSGVNFHPSRVSTGLEDEKSTLENGVRERLASDVAICTFGAPNDSESFSKGVKIGEWSLACSLPSKIGTGFVNVGIGSASRSDARFLFGPEFLVNLLAKPVLYNVVGPTFRARGDVLQVAGSGMIVLEASIASPGHPTFCGWCFANTERVVEASKPRGGSFGAFVSSALRSCEVPTLLGVVALQARATVDSSVLAYRELSDTCTTGPIFTIVDPPHVLSVEPAMTNSKGGELLHIETSDLSLSSNLSAVKNYRSYYKAYKSYYRPLIRIGTFWVEAAIQHSKCSNRGQLLNVVAPAQKSTSFSEVDFAISNNFFGSGIRHHGQGDEAASSTVVSSNPLGHAKLTYPLQENIHLHGLSLDDLSERHHYISLASHQNANIILTTLSKIASVAKIRQLITASGPKGGGGMVWVTGTSLQAISQGGGGMLWYCSFSNIGITVFFVSSGLVVCEAPSSEMLPKNATSVPFGLFHKNHTITASTTYSYMPKFNILEWWPGSGSAYGGTRVVILSFRNGQATVSCRFGTVTVIGFFADAEASVVCVSPAMNAGFVDLMIGGFYGAVHVSGFGEAVGSVGTGSSSQFHYFNNFD